MGKAFRALLSLLDPKKLAIIILAITLASLFIHIIHGYRVGIILDLIATSLEILHYPKRK